VFCDDVSGLELSGFSGESTRNSAPFFWLKNAKNVRIQNCLPFPLANTFLRIEGENTDSIVLFDTSTVKSVTLVDLASEVDRNQIKIIPNQK
jgi:hypothetical protein